MRKQEEESEGVNSDFESKSNLNTDLKIASSDETLLTVLDEIKSSKSPAVINYGASWYVITKDQFMLTRCGVCSQILPTFKELSKKFQRIDFVYADIDECPETTLNIRYTPTFQFYRDGEKVDEMYGAGEQRLHDRLWLHS